jgi:3-phosphoshikimate 1-carboxyvinyltransferase
MEQVIHSVTHVAGRVTLPGDKSIAHRAAILAALADGPSEIVNFPDARDPQSTLSCLQQLGIPVEVEESSITVQGRGLDGLRPPDDPIDCGNSGTTMRLLAGVLAGQPFPSVLIGDESLSLRPMERIAEPLRQMGARIELTDGHAPIRIFPSPGGLRPITYRLPVASAQVKSCVLLAGLYADGETTVVESSPSRDHTERMLRLEVLHLGSESHISVAGGRPIRVRGWAVPRDFSAAAFFLVAGCLVPNAIIEIPGVGVNPSRAGALDVLNAMGAHIDRFEERAFGGESIADLRIRSSALTSVRVDGALIPNLIDEIPVLAVAAAVAHGTTEIRDASELRVKETDRIRAMVTNLRRLGAEVDEHDDGLTVHGGKDLTGATVDSFGDHRVAMAMGVAALAARGETTIRDANCANISFPGFWQQLRAVARQ